MLAEWVRERTKRLRDCKVSCNLPKQLQRGGGGRKIYCLQCDIAKYFASLDHAVLQALIGRKIADKRVMWLIDQIMQSSFDQKIYLNLFDFRLAGIPIGNLTSQLFANIYLNELDQFVKRFLRVKYYLRYMDDFLILSPCQAELFEWKKIICEFLEKHLKLTLHPSKATVFPVERGIEFLGYKVFRDHRLVLVGTVKRFSERVRLYRHKMAVGVMSRESFAHSLESWFAYAEFGNSWRLRQRLTLELCL